MEDRGNKVSKVYEVFLNYVKYSSVTTQEIITWTIRFQYGDNKPENYAGGVLNSKEFEKVIRRVRDNDMEFLSYFFMAKADIAHAQVTMVIHIDLEERAKF